MTGKYHHLSNGIEERQCLFAGRGRGERKMKKVIVVIDMQNDFIDGSLGTKEAQAMLPRLVAKLAREREAALIFTQDTHDASYLETQEGKQLSVAHCIKPSQGWEIAPALAPYVARAAAVIEKPAVGASGGRAQSRAGGDRAHGALHGYLRHRQCDDPQGGIPRDSYLGRRFLLRRGDAG